MGHGLPRPHKQHRSFAVFEGFYCTSDFGLCLLSLPLLTFGVSELTPSLPVFPYLLPSSCKVTNSSLCSMSVQEVALLGRRVRTGFAIKAFPGPSKTSHCCQTLTQRRCSLSIGKVIQLVAGPSEMSVPCTGASGQC